jgi:hypothetical protein
MLISPWLPELQHPWLRAIQVDRYYQLLVPLTVPVTILAVRAGPAAAAAALLWIPRPLSLPLLAATPHYPPRRSSPTGSA